MKRRAIAHNAGWLATFAPQISWSDRPPQFGNSLIDKGTSIPVSLLIKVASTTTESSNPFRSKKLAPLNIGTNNIERLTPTCNSSMEANRE